jgi:hypothetical protein
MRRGETALARSRELRKQTERAAGRANHLRLTSGEALNRSRPRSIGACPSCGKALDWIERGRLDGVEYDYYHWCESGCGLYCYERRAETWIKLV